MGRGRADAAERSRRRRGAVAPTRRRGDVADAQVSHARTHAGNVVRAFATSMRQWKSDYLVPGEGFTAADILFVHCLDWGASIGWADDWADASLDAYVERCRGRAAYQRAKALP